MLTRLSIQNYALIDQLDIDFKKGFSIITGETGAGKSILLGALGLVLGNRADLSSLKDTTKKCVIEAEFSLKDYNLESKFEELGLDYDDISILRREILASGKSRAFVNDTPVRLNSLNTLKTYLMDIHSQHETLALSDQEFQYSIIDALAKNQTRISSYKRGLAKLKKLKNDLKVLVATEQEAKQQYDYNLHLFDELEKANFEDINEQSVLEEKLEKLNNIEDIKLNLTESIQIGSSEEVGVQSLLHKLAYNLSKIQGFSDDYQSLYERIASVKIEFSDILLALEQEEDVIVFDPNVLEQLNDRLQLIYSLQKKHNVATISELQQIHEELSVKVNDIANVSDRIEALEQQISKVASKLDQLAQTISKAREKVIPKLIKELEGLMSQLGMKNARFQISVKLSDNYFINGKDELNFLFSANKGGNFGQLKKVASGGELSRIMLCVKKILSEHVSLPTIIFDEIDTGVSGEVSNKMAEIMQLMSARMQVMTITHLPQVASKGEHHYKVYKHDVDGLTHSNLKKLSDDQRVLELAEMLHGKTFSDSAINHAKQLLNM